MTLLPFAPIVRCLACGIRLARARLLCRDCARPLSHPIVRLLYRCLDCELPVGWRGRRACHLRLSAGGVSTGSAVSVGHRPRTDGVRFSPAYAFERGVRSHARSLDGDARGDDGDLMNEESQLVLPIDPEALDPELARRLADPTLTKRFSIEIEIRLASGGRRSFNRAIEAPRADDAIEAAERLPFEDWLDGDEEISDYEIRASGWQSL